ncbi:MAG TPA: Crp/Fnr family transcriptional regulator [Kofleriaceae bacterium]|nr:Crp/Fnr family transcriptional regulator [Kofleriaceae bacterium]
MSDPILDTLDAATRQEVEAASRVLRFRSGEHVIVEGQEPDAIYFLRRGAIRVYHRGVAEREIVVMFCRAPAMFGEIEVIRGVPHIENVASMTDDTEILAVPRAVFLALMEREPRVTLALLHDTCAKLAMASHNQKALACQDVRTRLATFLVSYAMFDGAPRGAAEVRIRAQLTQDDMAAALGVTRRAVAQEIARWTKLGVLDRDDGRYVVRQMAALSNEAATAHIGLVYDGTVGLVVVPGSGESPPGMSREDAKVAKI